MKKTFLFLMLLFSTLLIEAQNTFSKLYSLSDSTGWFFTDFERYIVDNDTIIGYGEAVRLNADSTTNQGIFLYRVDSSGNAIDHIIHFDTLGESLAVEEDWGNIIAPSVGGYAALGATTGRNSFLFFKLKDDLSIEFIKEYPDTFNIRNFRHSIAEVKGGYIIWGSVQKPDLDSESRIKYVDYSGEIIWEEKLQRSISTVLDAFESINDSLFIIVVGHGDGIGNIIQYTIEEFNLKQEFETKWSINTERKDFVIKNIHRFPTGDILIFASEEVDKINNNIVYSSTLVKLNEDYQFEKQTLFGHPVFAIFSNPDPQLKDFIFLDDNIYGAGASLYPITDINNGIGIGVLYNFNSSLDSIWARSHRVEIPPSEGFGNFLTIDTLSSGNLILAGIAREWFPNKDFGWIIKTPPDGCLSPQKCDFISPVSSVEEQNPETAIHLYPNPTDAILTIELPEDFGDATLQVFNLTGQLLHTAQAAHQYQLSTKAMQSGIYFLKVIGKDKITTTQKFQVIH